jgi:outer membrane receptor for ferrienterochelin and colicins
VNFGSARVYGVEMNVGWGIGDTFVLQGGIVEQRARFDQAEPDFGSRDFFRTPRRYANATLTWRAPVLDIFAAGRYTGPMQAPHFAGYIAESRLETTPSFVVFDLGVSRTFRIGDGPRLVLGITGRNLTGPRFPRSIGASIRVEY